MSLPPEALQKLYQEVQTQAIKAQQDIDQARAQRQAKQRDIRLIALTRSEIATLPPETPAYEGVGKMFVATTLPVFEKKLEAQAKDLVADNEALGKKLVYLETTAKNSQAHIESMLKHGA